MVQLPQVSARMLSAAHLLSCIPETHCKFDVDTQHFHEAAMGKPSLSGGCRLKPCLMKSRLSQRLHRCAALPVQHISAPCGTFIAEADHELVYSVECSWAGTLGHFLGLTWDCEPALTCCSVYPCLRRL